MQEIIRSSTFRTYNSGLLKDSVWNPSSNRLLKSEHVHWQEKIFPRLTDIVLQFLASRIEEFDISEIPEKYRFSLWQIIPINLPLSLTSNTVEDGIYWERCCNNKWPREKNDLTKHGYSWKRMYMEKYLQEYIENLYPDCVDTNDLSDMLECTCRYVLTLNIEQLLSTSINCDDTNDDNKMGKLDRVNLHPIISRLPYLKELSLSIGIKNCGLNFSWDLSYVSLTDCKNINSGLQEVRDLMILRVHRCSLNDDEKLRALLQNLHNMNLIKLEVSSCDISDDGANVIADLLALNTSIKSLNLVNNRIGIKGASTLASILSNSALEEINLRLNPIADKGVIDIFSVLDNSPSILKLILSACRLTDKCVEKMCSMFRTNRFIREIELSSNNIGQNAGNLIASALKDNNTLQRLDLRMTNINENDRMYIEKRLKLNRKVMNIPRYILNNLL